MNTINMEAVQSAVAIADTFFAARLINSYVHNPAQAWSNLTGEGVIELYDEIAKFGALSAKFSAQQSQKYASGVYAYRVDNDFGTYFSARLFDKTYDFEKASQYLQNLVIAFYRCPVKMKISDTMNERKLKND